MSIALETTFRQKDLDPYAASEAALSLVAALDLSEPSYQIWGQGSQTPVSKLLAQLKKKRNPFFAFEGKNIAVSTSPALGEVTSVEVRFLAGTPPLKFLDDWVPQLAAAGTAIHARLTDPQWEKWQNEKMVQNFETTRRSTKKLKLVWDSDWERDVVDISVNPGRFAERNGYMEALGHEMWLMPAFWQLAKADRPLIERRFASRALPDGTIAVTLSKGPFNDDNPPTEEMRKLLFP